MGTRVPVRHRLSAAVSLAVASAVVVVGTGLTATAAPADTTTLFFEVVGTTSGDLHIAVAPDGGLALPFHGSGAAAALADTAVIDSRGGGTREWTASVATTGFDDAMTLSYKVVSPTDPGTGSLTNRMPDWTAVSSPRDVLAVSAINQPSATWTWTPHLRLDIPVRGSGSIGPTSPAVSGALITSAL